MWWGTDFYPPTILSSSVTTSAGHMTPAASQSSSHMAVSLTSLPWDMKAVLCATDRSGPWSEMSSSSLPSSPGRNADIVPSQLYHVHEGHL